MTGRKPLLYKKELIYFSCSGESGGADVVQLFITIQQAVKNGKQTYSEVIKSINPRKLANI